VYAATETTQEIQETQKIQKDGLVQEKGKYHYYQKGKLVKKKWQTIKGKKYYFKSNGDAAIGSYKIEGTYYIFNAKGQLCNTKKKVVTVNSVKYGVNKNGKALLGIQVIGENFYSFSNSGKYDATKTKKLQSAAKEKKSMTNLYKLIGKPKKSKYLYGCYGTDGKDGILTYKNFTVYTYKYTTGKNKGKEIFMGVE
jgi:glucan-binding YG repeat protein